MIESYLTTYMTEEQMFGLLVSVELVSQPVKAC